jgi:hypothetical protein
MLQNVTEWYVFKMRFPRRAREDGTKWHDVERFEKRVLPATRTRCNQMQQSATF